MQRKTDSLFFLVEKVQVDLSLATKRGRLSRGRGGFVSVAISGRGDGSSRGGLCIYKNE